MRILLVELIIIIALYTDLRYRKIPNVLTFFGIASGIVINIPNGSMDSVLGLVLVMAAFIPVYIMGAVAAGDVKVLMAIGVLTGYKFTIEVLLFTIACNLIITAVVLVKKKRLKNTLQLTYNELKYRLLIFFGSKKAAVLEKPSIEANTQIPYMPAIAIGVNMAYILF